MNPRRERVERRPAAILAVDVAGDIFGYGVNIAPRLEALAEPSGICLSVAAQNKWSCLCRRSRKSLQWT
jgi:class 3 adenylate cyclase